MVTFNKLRRRCEIILTEPRKNPDIKMVVNANKSTPDKAKEYITMVQKLAKADLKLIDKVEKARDVTGIYIRIEGKSQSKAYVEVYGKDWSVEYVGKKTSGWGYDKDSKTVANAFNQSPELLKLIFTDANKDPITKARFDNSGAKYVLWGDTTPRWQGGIGMSSYEHYFRSIGFDTDSYYDSRGDIHYKFTKSAKKKRK